MRQKEKNCRLGVASAEVSCYILPMNNFTPYITRNYPESNDALCLTEDELVELAAHAIAGGDVSHRVSRAFAMSCRRGMVDMGRFPGGRKIKRIIADVKSGAIQ